MNNRNVPLENNMQNKINFGMENKIKENQNAKALWTKFDKNPTYFKYS